MTVFRVPQTRSMRSLWMLEGAGSDYEMQFVDIRSTDRRDSDELLAARGTRRPLFAPPRNLRQVPCWKSLRPTPGSTT
jgi:hypothetical protein